jgi:hypothetical protein
MSALLSAHRVLEYLLTKAAVTGQLKSTKVRIPYKELAASIGSTEAQALDLIVKIDLEWDEQKTDEEVEMEADSGPENFEE